MAIRRPVVKRAIAFGVLAAGLGATAGIGGLHAPTSRHLPKIVEHSQVQDDYKVPDGYECNNDTCVPKKSRMAASQKLEIIIEDGNSRSKSSINKPKYIADMSTSEFEKVYSQTTDKNKRASFLEQFVDRFLYEENEELHTRNLNELYLMKNKNLRYLLFKTIFDNCVSNLHDRSEYKLFLDFIYSFPKEYRKYFFDKLKAKEKQLKD